MRYLKYMAVLGLLMFLAGPAHAQVAVRVGPVYVGPPPACAYGYYGYYPYACAPYGYYGPDYFAGGVFIGAGPWFRGYYDRSYYGGWRDFDGRGWYRHEDGFRDRDDFRGEGGWHGDRGFRDDRGFHGRDFHGGEGFHGGGEFHGGGSHSRDDRFRGGEGFHGGGHR